MHLSTSNSDAGMHWQRIWLMVAVLTIATIGVWELVLRSAGLKPEFTDNQSLWLSARHELSRPDATVVALLGASRIQRAIDVDTLSRTLHRPIVQLAVEGSSGLPVLENLAADPRFRGTAIVSIAPAFSFNRKLSKLDDGDQAGWTRAYVDQSRTRRMEQELRLFFQGLFAFRSTDASFASAVEAIAQNRTLPVADYKTTRRNRFVSIDQDKFATERTQDGIVALYTKNSEPYEKKGFDELLRYFSAVVDVHNNKGSRVIILRLPSAGKVLAFEQEHFPKDRFWNQMTKNIDATFIHFEDYPQLIGYLGKDGSHIDSDKASAFTEQLASVLEENGL